MPKTILCRKVYKFRMEPTELEALELERTASVARAIYNWGLERCQEYYQQRGKSKPWGEPSAELTQLKQTSCGCMTLTRRCCNKALADLRRLQQLLRAPSQVPEVQKNKSGPALVSYPQAGSDGEGMPLCTVDRPGQDSPVAGDRSGDQECHL